MMRAFFQRQLTFFLLAFFLPSLLFLPKIVFSAPVAPNIVFTYSGRLLDDNGVPLSDNTIGMQFRLYTASSGGTCLWSNDYHAGCGTESDETVTLSSGLFSVALGAGAMEAIDPTVFTDNANVYLEVEVEGEVMTPRKQITAAPFAVSSYSSYSLQGLFPDSTVGASEIVRTSAAGKILFSGATGISNSVTDAVLRIDASTSEVNDPADVLFAITTDSGANTVFSVTRDYVSLVQTLELSGTDDSGNSIFSRDGLTLGTTEHGVDISIQDLDSDGALVWVGFSEEYPDTLASGESVDGIQIDLANDYILHASGNPLTGLRVTMGNGGANVSTGISIGGASDYGITLSGYTSSALRFDTGATTFSSDLNYNISADPGGSGDFVLYSSGGSKFAIDTSGTTSPETGYFSIGASTASTIGVNLDAGIYLDFQTNTSSSNTDFFPIMIQTKGGTGGGIYLDGCNGAGPGAEACDDGADWTANGIVFRDFHYDITTATDSLGEGDFWLDIVPKGDGGVEVDLSLTDGIQLGDDADNKKFRVTSSIFEGDATQELFEVERSDGGVNFTGVLARFTNLESSSGSHGEAVIIENDAGGDSIGLTVTQRQVGVVDAGGGAFKKAHAFVIEVEEAQSNDDVMVFYSDSDGTPDVEFIFENDGDAFADGAFTGGGADLAEFFLSDDASLGAHDVVCQAEQVNAVRRCGLGERNVLGVISTNPAFIGNNVGGASVDLRNDPRYRLVGLVGQVETRVTAADGAIRVGDALTTSSFVEGAAGKASGPSFIIGRALEPLASGSGTIKVLVQPMWWAGDLFSTDGDVAIVHNDLQLSGQGLRFSGALPQGNFLSGAGFDQRFLADGGQTSLVWSSFEGDSLLALRSTGDLLVAGRVYLGDDGVLQDDHALYYDGFSGGVIRTSAAGWASASHGFAETFAAEGDLVPGDVVMLGSAPGQVALAQQSSDRTQPLGVVVQSAGFLAGERTMQDVAVVTSGRSFARVTLDSGTITPGDPLTLSATPGVLTKATQNGPILGYALAYFDAGVGMLEIFVQPTYYVVGEVLSAEGVTGDQSVSHLNITGDITMMGGVLRGIGRLEGLTGVWSIAEDGGLVTRGSIEQLTAGHNGQLITTTVQGTFGRTVTLSGTAVLQQGRAEVRFPADYLAVVSPALAPRVFVTPYSFVQAVAVSERTPGGFVISSSGGETGVAVDWYVIAPHKDGEEAWMLDQSPEPQQDTSGDVVEDPIEDSSPDVIEEIPEQLEDPVEDIPVVEVDVPPEDQPVEEDVVPEPALE